MISIKELIELQKQENLNIIDIRDNYNYTNGHIPTSQNIIENKLLITPQYYLNFKETYYIYCKNGERSKRVVNILKQQGYKVVNIEGGYNNYLLMK